MFKGGPNIIVPNQQIIDLSAIGTAVQASLLTESLVDFAKASWHVLEPQTPLKWDWALDAICEHLEAVTRGEITHLLMNVPPGCMKSLLTGVVWPAWEWTNPKLRGMRYLGTSHKQDLAVRDSTKCRRLIQSAWYQKRWPIKLVSDQNAKTKFENEATGFREAMAFGSMTGSRGDRVILDDPLSVDDGNSLAALEAAKTTFLESLPTRVNNENSAIVVIMQRLNELDTSGVILDKKLDYVHLMLPMRFEEKRRCTTRIGFRDPRKKEGELLFPERFSEKVVASLEKTMGSYATAGQFQQRPTPRGGGLFKTSHFKLWPADKPLPAFKYIVQSYDTAFTEDTANDKTASETWGVFDLKGKNNALLLDAWHDWLDYAAVRKRVLADWKAKYGGEEGNDLNPGRRADAVLIENKGSGISIIQELRSARVPALPYNPGKADKWARAQMALPLFELDVFYLLESKRERGEPVTWARPFVAEVGKFGPLTVKDDDYVDAFTQAVIFLKDSDLLQLPVVEEEPETERDYRKNRRPRNPYG